MDNLLPILGPIAVLLSVVWVLRRQAKPKTANPQAPLETWPSAASRLEICLVRDSEAAGPVHTESSETHGEIDRSPPAQRTLLPGLLTTLVAPLGERDAAITEGMLARWGVDFDQAMLHAHDNLEAHARKYELAHVEAMTDMLLHMLKPEREIPGFASALLLSEFIRARLTKQIGPDVVVLLPDRDTMFVGELTEETIPVAMQAAATLFADAPHPLYELPIAWRADGDLYTIMPAPDLDIAPEDIAPEDDA